MTDDARLGLLVVHNDPVPEAEIWRTAPEGIDIVTGRFRLQRRTGEEYAGESPEEFLRPEVLTTLRHLVAAGCARIGLCFLSVSAWSGPDFDHAVAELAQVHTGAELFTSGQALREQIKARGGRRLMVMAPPWFTDDSIAAIASYLEADGASVVRCERFALSGDWSAPPQDLFDLGAKDAIDPDQLGAQILAAAQPGIDTVVLPGSGFRSLQAVRSARTQTSLPIITANSAVLAYHQRRAPVLSDLVGVG